MLRRDFVSKVIEQMVNAVARLLELKIQVEPEKFSKDFEEILQNYFKLNPDDLPQLLEKNDERDALLLDEKSKNHQIKMFIRAGFAFVQANQIPKAKTCLTIIERIRESHADVFEFPTEESSKINSDLVELKELTRSTH